MTRTPLEITLDALAHLLCCDRETNVVRTLRSPGGIDPRHHLKPQVFDGFELLEEGLYDDEMDPGVLIGDDPLDQPVWPIDAVIAHTTSHPDWPEGSWQFTRYKTLNMKDWRGRLTATSPRMLEQMVMIAKPDGIYTSARCAYTLGRKGCVMATRDPGDYTRGHKEDARQIAALVRMAGGFMLRKRYLWSVLIGEGACPRARFVTDPTGIREVFRLRDIPPGRLRRAALLHWVNEHWRKRRDAGANDRTFIREHVRGVWSYTWDGLRCQIEPAELDIERLTGESVNQ